MQRDASERGEDLLQGKLTQEGSSVDGGAEEGVLRHPTPARAVETNIPSAAGRQEDGDVRNQAVFSPDGRRQTAAAGSVPSAEAFSFPGKHTHTHSLETRARVESRREKERKKRLTSR